MKWNSEHELAAQVGTSKKVKHFAWYPVVVNIKLENNKRIYTWAWLETYYGIYTYQKLSRNFKGLPHSYYGWVFQYGEVCEE